MVMVVAMTVSVEVSRHVRLGGEGGGGGGCQVWVQDDGPGPCWLLPSHEKSAQRHSSNRYCKYDDIVQGRSI